jgi:uncharacterized protein (DUF58 family)
LSLQVLWVNLVADYIPSRFRLLYLLVALYALGFMAAVLIHRRAGDEQVEVSLLDVLKGSSAFIVFALFAIYCL